MPRIERYYRSVYASPSRARAGFYSHVNTPSWARAGFHSHVNTPFLGQSRLSLQDMMQTAWRTDKLPGALIKKTGYPDMRYRNNRLTNLIRMGQG